MLKDHLKALLNPISLFKHPASLLYPNSYNNDRFVEYLRSKGATIGTNTRFINPRNCHVDINRANYISIGENCSLSFVTLLAHDYSWYTFLDAFNDVLPDGGGEIVIGNNCFLGYEAVVLKNTHIGDNVIIGARAVVKGNIPSNTVWAGAPARQICTLEELYERRKRRRIEEAMFRRDHIRDIFHRDPTIKEMGVFGFLFLERSKDNYERYIKGIEFNGVKDHVGLNKLFFESTPCFTDFDEFLAFITK